MEARSQRERRAARGRTYTAMGFRWVEESLWPGVMYMSLHRLSLSFVLFFVLFFVFSFVSLLQAGRSESSRRLGRPVLTRGSWGRELWSCRKARRCPKGERLANPRIHTQLHWYNKVTIDRRQFYYCSRSPLFPFLPMVCISNVIMHKAYPNKSG